VVGEVGKGIGWWALVAADDSEFWFSLRRELPGLEERLLTVRTGRDCLRAIEDRRIRLLVLDGSMGDVSGMHLLHLVRQIRPDLGIVVTFSQSDQVQEREARQAGILYYGDRQDVREIAQVLRKGLVPAGGCFEPDPHA
jgi:CheY-like chemotaxis protein